jgi:hypothetical protein
LARELTLQSECLLSLTIAHPIPTSPLSEKHR